jgi:lipopolysaccharide/colanic/teichoic acid biosynthesis glycosyltransferase
MIKRCFDILVSTLALILLSPILLFLIAAIRLLLGAPVFFVQERPGLRGKPFRILKFRTMRNAIDASGNPLPDEKRLTRFGRLLRSLSLDELPELLNVLRGDMSLVGPRPLLMEYLPRYSSTQARRHEIRPGLTGWAQINGRNALSWEEKFELDIWYIDNQSFFLDIKILFLTAWHVVWPAGISAEGHATMPIFTGSAKKIETPPDV